MNARKDSPLPSPSPLLRNLTSYRPPRPTAPVDLRLDGNEGPPPPAALLDAVRELGAEGLVRYPDAAPLEAQIAAALDVDQDRVLVTAGADDALERAIRGTLAPGREIVLPAPTFEMLERYARLAGGRVRAVEWLAGGLPVDDLLGAVTTQTAAVVAVTPNSPTGLAASLEELRRLSRGLRGVLLVVDLAYVEFADRDPTRALLELDNTVVVRTFSKAWGLAGLRVGWAAGPPEVIGWLRTAGHPYAVATPSLALAAARFATGRAEVERAAEEIRRHRAALTATLAELGVTVWPSQANFVLARLGAAAGVRDALAERGIGVRIFPGQPLLDGCLRITVPARSEDLTRLERALAEVL